MNRFISAINDRSHMIYESIAPDTTFPPTTLIEYDCNNPGECYLSNWDDNEPDTTSNMGWIVGLACGLAGCIVILGGAIVIGVFFCKKSKPSDLPMPTTTHIAASEQLEAAPTGTLACLSPNKAKVAPTTPVAEMATPIILPPTSKHVEVVSQSQRDRRKTSLLSSPIPTVTRLS